MQVVETYDELNLRQFKFGITKGRFHRPGLTLQLANPRAFHHYQLT